MEQNPLNEREISAAYIEYEYDKLITARARANRSDRMDSQLVGNERALEDRMNLLLEEYFSRFIHVEAINEPA